MSANKPSPSKLSGDTGEDLKSLGKYTIERKLGAGGMGTVYLALDAALNRPVALKVLPKERAENPILVRRFKAEGQAAAVLEHKNIIRVYDAGEADGFLYLALEYVDGIDVLEWMRKRGIIPVKRSLDIVRQIAEALSHASSKNIVHRDIKPSNIMIARDGTAKLADMGLARSVDDTLDTSITRDGTTVGTVDYMSPEQAANSKAADVRSDIYSLGCTWYHMLTGVPPFNKGGVTEKLTDHARKPPPDPREVNERVSEAIVAVLHRMMAKKQEFRYQSAEQLLEDLNNESLLRGGNPTNLLAMLTADDSHYDLSHEAEAIDKGASQQSYQPIDHDKAPASPTRRSQSTTDQGPADEEPGPAKRPVKSNQKGSNSAPQNRQSATPTKPDTQQTSSKNQRTRPGRQVEQSSDATSEGNSGSRSQSAPIYDASEDHRAQEHLRTQREKSLGQTDQPQTSTTRKPASQNEPETVDAPQQNLPRSVKESASEERKRRGKAMPPRASNVTEPVQSQTKINIDFKQIGLVTVAIAGLVGGGWWVVNYLGNSNANSAIAPYAKDNLPPEQQDPKPDHPVVEANAAQPENMEPTDPADVAKTTDVTAVKLKEISRFDFPGVEDQMSDAARLRELLPEWLLQGWGTPSSKSDNTYHIGRGLSGQKRAFPSLKAGLENAPVVGATLVLTGNSIYTPPGVTIERCQHLVIKPGDSSVPVVWINGNNLDKEGTWLTFGKGTLELDGIHFVINADHTPATKLKFLELTEANLIVRNCSFTIVGEGKTQTQLVTLKDRSATGNRILWENCIVQGVNTTAAVLDAPEFDMVAGNCMFATTSANMFEILPTGESKSDDARLFKLMGCSIVTDQTAINLTHASTDTPPVPVTLGLYRNLFAAAPGTQSTFIRLNDWPLNKTQDLDAARPAAVTLNFQHTRLAGWGLLTSMKDDKGESHVAENDSSWRQFWRSQFPSDDLLPAVEEFSKNTIALLSRDELQTALAPLANGGLGARAELGCVLSHVEPLPAGYQTRFQATANRIRLPELFGQKHSVSKTVRFDLKRVVTLQNFLESPDCPNGTHVICFGSGLKSVPPLHLENRRLRIEFEQTTDAPLLLRPASSDQGAMITINGGQIDLVNAHFELLQSSSKTYPGTFIKANGEASFSLRSCRVVGPEEITPGVPLIWVEDTIQGTAACSISDSVLMAKGPIFQANLAGKVVEFDNTLMVSTQNALKLRAGQHPGNLLLHQCTLSASGAAVHFSASPRSEPIDLFVKNSVFAPGLASATGELNCVLATDDQKVIGSVLRWWDSGTAYSNPIPHFTSIDGMPGGNDFSTDWNNLWGSGHAIDVLHGPQAVTLASVVSNWGQLEPAQFQLKDSCDAHQWTEEGGPVGIDNANIGPKLAPPAPEKPTTPGLTPATPLPQNGNRPVRPKGPDF